MTRWRWGCLRTIIYAARAWPEKGRAWRVAPCGGEHVPPSPAAVVLRFQYSNRHQLTSRLVCDAVKRRVRPEKQFAVRHRERRVRGFTHGVDRNELELWRGA